MLFLLGMSLWFYGYFDYYYLLIMISSIVFNYLFYQAMKRCQTQCRSGLLIKKSIFWIAIAFNIGLLFYFKYFDFAIENINAIARTDFALRHIVLPLGISFFTFQQLSFVIDSYKGEIPDYNFIDYACFVTYFPQLVAGPIVTHDELIPQFMDQSKKKFDWDNFSKGIYIFALGMAKKVLLADVLGEAVNWGWSNLAEIDSLSAMVVVLSYTLQIYFDFSGYSDMAIGMAKMMNIDLPLNFNSPYKALTINEFWDRWHMTLTRFFTRYVYIPLGGNRKGKARTYINIMIVYLVSGIWHGANWTFVFWGVCHGAFCVLTRAGKKYVDKLHPALNWMITFAFVNVMWVFFRADSMADAFTMLSCIASQTYSGISPELAQCFVTAEWRMLFQNILKVDFLTVFPNAIMTGYLLISVITLLGMDNAYERMLRLKPSLRAAVMVAVLLVLCIFSFAGVSTFLYFNF